MGQVKDIPVKFFADNKVLILQKAPGAFMVGSIVTALVAFVLKKTGKNKEAK